MAAPSKIPVFVLTGFLGSGKTVLLNSLLRQTGFADSAVVVNEFGEIGLDHLLASSSQENIVLLDAGCLCCAVLGSLKETLLDLHRQRAQGSVTPFQRVLIETTGLADPAPIMQSISRDSLVSAFFHLAGLVCVVDAVFGLDVLGKHVEARAQVAQADVLLVTKTDLTSDECPDALTQCLRRLNPTAEIIMASHGQVAAEKVVGASDNGAPWMGDLSRLELAEPGAGHPHDHPSIDDQPRHDGTITSESFWIESRISWSGLAAWIEAMRRTFGADLLRCKGIVNVAGSSVPVALHGVQTVFDTARMDGWPDAERRTRLVIIGRNLERQQLAALLPWLSVEEGTMLPLGDTLIPPPMR